ncbi:MAG: T9SS type A sorting domain-containing protein, partial [Candidatus Kapaibacteriota bacterium]
NGSSAPMLVVENGELLVRWNMPSELIHRISVMDIRGSIVAQFESGDVSGGIITLEGLSQGMYFLDVMMKDGSHQMSHAMLIR